MKIVKVVFNKPDGSHQKEYSYSWQDEIEIGDTVIVDLFGRDKSILIFLLSLLNAPPVS